MASQRDVKRRIDSVKNIRKITRAMEMVAAARLRRAEQRIAHLRPYADAIRRMTRQAADAAGAEVGKLREGEWGDEIQDQLRKAIGDFADDFGYDLDEEGHPIEDREVGETTREAEGIRSRDEDGNGAGEESEESEHSEEEEEAATTAS